MIAAFRALMAGVSVRTRTEVLLGAVLLASLAWQTHAKANAEHRAGALALQADTLRAVHDTTRRLTMALNILAAGTQAVQRQAVQVIQRSDSIDRALKLERVAKDDLTATIAELRAQGTTTVAVANGTDTASRVAVFTGRQMPYTFRDSVTLPTPPHTATQVLTVSVDSLALEVRLGCGRPNADGIRSAQVTVTGPTWARLSLGRVEQSPDLCHSPALEPTHGDGRSWIRRAIDRAGIDIGYGVTRTPDGHAVFAPAVIVGVKVWP